MNIRIEIHNRNLTKRKQRIGGWKISSEDKKSLLRFLEDLELGKVNKGRKISETRQIKYLDLLKTPLEYFEKTTSKLTLKDMEGFEKALSSDSLKSRRGLPYFQATKVDIRKALKIYLRWKLGPEKSIKLTGWLDTRAVVKTPDFLKESEIEKLFHACKSAEERFLIAMLFDTGARATEFHNIRYEDVQLPEGQNNMVKIVLKQEYSKTKGRTISLYWKHSTGAVKEYLQERVRDGIRSNEAVFKNSYTAARLFLRRLGQKVLGRPIHYHLFRHSSATYYADKMNRQQLCIRYGWAFSGNMVDVYISRVGMDSKELDEKFTYTEIETLREALAKKDESDKMKDDRIKQLENAVKNMEMGFAKIMEIRPSIEDVEAALEKKKRLG